MLHKGTKLYKAKPTSGNYSSVGLHIFVFSWEIRVLQINKFSQLFLLSFRPPNFSSEATVTK